MNARRLCNWLYAFIVEGMDSAEVAAFDERLNPADPNVQDRRRNLVLLAGGEIG